MVKEIVVKIFINEAIAAVNIVFFLISWYNWNYLGRKLSYEKDTVKTEAKCNYKHSKVAVKDIVQIYKINSFPTNVPHLSPLSIFIINFEYIFFIILVI